mmetsp:Transcript_29838/g.82200  ORF Transcript_29838/g.82200 Transcript_29838/m.82200 type:complete len:326 (+) Transcript_29838:2111-3088(+)
MLSCQDPATCPGPPCLSPFRGLSFSLAVGAKAGAAAAAGSGPPSRSQPSACRRTSSSQTCILVYSFAGLCPPPPWPEAAPGAADEDEEEDLSVSNCVFIALRRSARFTCSAETSVERSIRGSAISLTAVCSASSRTCSGALEKTASNSQPPSWPLMSPTSAWRPERTFRAAPPRRSDDVGSSWLSGAMRESVPAPCSRTSMQWRPPRLPLTHWRRACFAASVTAPHSRSPPSAAAPAAEAAEARSRLGFTCTSRGRRPCGAACCGWGCSSCRNHCSSTWARPFGCTWPRPGALEGSSVSAGCVQGTSSSAGALTEAGRSRGVAGG